MLYSDTNNSPNSLIDKSTIVGNYHIKFKDASQPSGDVCLFSSYSFTETVDEYVYYYLDALKKAGFSIAFISTSRLKDTCIAKIKQYAFLIVERENKCPDFGSWKLGLYLLDWCRKFNSVLLANDSVFGPFYDLGKIISSMKKKFDVWGMTDSYEVDYHIQSYFLHFNKKVLSSETWELFWKNVDITLSKQEVINRYEAGLTKTFSDAKFFIGAYAYVDVVSKVSDHRDKNVNATLAFWKTLIRQYDFPFLKREIIVRADINKVSWHKGLYFNMGGWRKLISQTSYPVSHIDNFLKNYYGHIKQTQVDIKLRKRKILFLTHNSEIGGAQRVILNFISWFKTQTDLPFEIISCLPGKNQLLPEFEALSNVSLFYSLSDHDKENLKEKLIEEQIALIFSNTIVNIEVQQFLSFLGVPQIVFVHELSYVLNAFPQIGRNIEWLRRNISHFIACSNAVKDTLIDYLKIEEDKVSVIYGFINEDAAVNKDLRSALMSELGIAKEAFVIGFCGTFEWRKSADLLPVMAATILNIGPDIHIVWLGADEGRELYQSVIFDLKKAGIKENVHLISKQADSRAFFQLIDVFVMASREDPFPLVNLESGMAGKPVICFQNAGGTEEYIALGTGRTVPYLNMVKLSDAIAEYYEDRHLLQTAKARIPGIIKANFTTEAQAPKIFEVIKRFYDVEELMLIESPTLTVMTHIYYDDSWEEIKSKLKQFDDGYNYFLFSISDACFTKKRIIEDINQSFKNAYCLVTSNIGKDIGGKFALIDIYLLLKIKSSYLVFLHDKQSPQTLVGEAWRKNLYKIIDFNNYKKIIRIFKDPKVGIVGAEEHIINEFSGETNTFRFNNDYIQSLLRKYNISISDYHYLSGTMYWLRASIVERFFSEYNPVSLRANLESGNVLDDFGATLTHTWERMFCWIATNYGYSIKGI